VRSLRHLGSLRHHGVHPATTLCIAGFSPSVLPVDCGLTFNLMADAQGESPYVGMILFLVLLLIGHVNSILPSASLGVRGLHEAHLCNSSSLLRSGVPALSALVLILPLHHERAGRSSVCEREITTGRKRTAGPVRRLLDY